MAVSIHHGDSRDVLKTLADASVDSVVCDPPYALVSITKRFGKPGSKPAKGDVYQMAASGFMSQTWDTGETAFAVEFWAEVYRVLKPGGHVVAFSGTRTYHRLACAIEDAGFEIRDMLSWLYGSGFPKSHDVAKGIDRVGGASPAAQAELLRRRRADAGLSRGEVAEAVGCTESSVRDWEEGRARAIGAAVEFVVPSPAYRSKLAALLGYTADERIVIGVGGGRRGVYETGHRGIAYGEPVSPLAQQWSGWGTALKPSQEPVVWATKPKPDQSEWVTIDHRISVIEDALWSMLPASAAEAISASSHLGRRGEFASAQWSAESALSTPEGLSDQTDMSPSDRATISSWSTASSWRRTLAATFFSASTSTTETGSSTTIDWRTLNSCLSKITPESIIQAHKSGAWSIVDAGPAEALFSANAASWRATLELSVAVNAIAKEPRGFLDGADLSPANEPIVFARKPLDGTVAANVQAHGTGALNIDGCRVGAPEGLTAGGLNKALAFQGGEGGGKERSLPHTLGRWPANVVLSVPEHEYQLRPYVTAEQRRELFGWLHENA